MNSCIYNYSIFYFYIYCFAASAIIIEITGNLDLKVRLVTDKLNPSFLSTRTLLRSLEIESTDQPFLNISTRNFVRSNLGFKFGV